MLRKKRTPSQVCCDNFDTKAKCSYYEDRYSKAFKGATFKLNDNLNNDSVRGRRGHGAPSISKTFNKIMLSSLNDCKIKPTTLYEAVASNQVGLLPATRGRPEKIPSKLCAALATQSAMMQLSSEGEASSVNMKALTEGLVAKTKRQGVFNSKYCWRKTQKNHPEILNPVKAKVNKDRRVEWLTYKNIMDWTARAKEFLISIGMAKDEPGIIHECLLCISNDTFRHSPFLSILSSLCNFRRGAIRYLADPP